MAKSKYSHFPVYLSKTFISLTKPKEVYDPFAGWGTRMVTFNALGIAYTGNDAWRKTYLGCKRIKKWLVSNGTGADIALHLGDSAVLSMRKNKHDAVFTCPPYPEAVEVYDNGAETLPINEYWKWWEKVVNKSVSISTKTFGLVIPEKWEAAFSEPIERKGFVLIHKEIVLLSGRKSSHLVKKKNFETMLIWRRK
jgi:tRNA G10  N-methylase Trm11